jgi:hypothetical protein
MWKFYSRPEGAGAIKSEITSTLLNGYYVEGMHDDAEKAIKEWW